MATPFLSTLSLRRATPAQFSLRRELLHFYPRSPCGERPAYVRVTQRQRDFYPRSPCGERQGRAVVACPRNYFYPRSPCGERPIPLRFPYG